MRVEVNDLRFSAGKKRILNGVSAVFEGNRIYGIVGQNGCGKTTLLKHLYRQYPARGHILVDGQPLERYSAKAYARRVAVMMQSYPEADMRVYDVVQTGRYPYKKVMLPYDREDGEITEEVLRRTRLWEMRDRCVHTLSGGERQRVMIARCLAQQPEAILLDEPTNHLDVRYKLELMEALQAFDGMVVMTLHDLNLAARYCDQICVMKDGAFIASGRPGSVLNDDILNRAFDVPIRTYELDGALFVNI